MARGNDKLEPHHGQESYLVPHVIKVPPLTFSAVATEGAANNCGQPANYYTEDDKLPIALDFNTSYTVCTMIRQHATF